MEIIKIEKVEYYKSDDIINSAPIYSKGVRNGREMIKKKKITDIEFIYGKLIDDKWVKSDGKSIKYDKVLIKKSFVDSCEILLNELNEESDDEKEIDDIKKAPKIIYLDDSEKFQDDKGNILEIETRGERECDKIYFKVKDVSKCFEMKNLSDIITKKKTKYELDKDYLYFICIETNNVRAKTNKKIIAEKELFLTYEGMLRVLFVSRNGKTSKFIKWATKTLFTVQMGTKTQKEKLVANVLGTSAEVVSEVFDRNSRDTPCIYGFTLGKVKDLRKSMKIDDKYDDEHMILKFGFTKSLSRRTNEHIKTFKNIKGCELKLKYYSYIDPLYMSKAEVDLKNYFVNLNCFIKYENNDELVILAKEHLLNTKDFYSSIGLKYAGHITEINTQLKDLDRKIETLQTEICNVKELCKKDIEIEKINNTNIVMNKDYEILKLNNELTLLQTIMKYETEPIIKKKIIKKLS